MWQLDELVNAYAKKFSRVHSHNYLYSELNMIAVTLICDQMKDYLLSLVVLMLGDKVLHFKQESTFSNSLPSFPEAQDSILF